MTPTIAVLVAVVAAYLLGSIPFGIVVSRVSGIADPRSFGSGNPGATNVLRSGNKGAAAATLLLDAFKGWLAVWLAATFGDRVGIDEAGVAAVALAVFLGHLYPVFFAFKGGKGVATALGVLLAIAWWLGLGTLLTWLIVVFFFRYSSLAALVAALFAPFYYALLVGFDAFAAVIVVMSALIIYRHRRNIANLIAGKEPRIGSKGTVRGVRSALRIEEAVAPTKAYHGRVSFVNIDPDHERREAASSPHRPVAGTIVDRYRISVYGPPTSSAFRYAGRAWMRWSQSQRCARLGSRPPRAANASTGKLIWMSAAVNASPANHSRVASSLSIHSRCVFNCGPMKVRCAFSATALTIGRTKNGIGPFGRRPKISASSSGGIADPSA